MSDLLNPANLIVLAVIAVGMFFGLRRIVASTHGKSCCSDGTSGKKAKKVVVADTDPSHYPYSDELLIGGRLRSERSQCPQCAGWCVGNGNVRGPHGTRTLEAPG